jgi:hypothetical protein
MVHAAGRDAQAGRDAPAGRLPLPESCIQSEIAVSAGTEDLAFAAGAASGRRRQAGSLPYIAYAASLSQSDWRLQASLMKSCADLEVQGLALLQRIPD